jgi:two-component system, cell cycle sensor histidine kinase and response regulator CckA
MCVQTVARLEEASGWSIVGHEQGCERTKTILLVEDEPFVREVTGEVLRVAGYRVLTAKNAKEGASLYEAQRGEVELLLTDIILPGETGRVLAGRLQREDPTLKVLFVSGYSEQMVASERMQEECLGKPFSSEVLLRTVRELLECVVLTNETEGQLMHACGSE